MASAQYPEVTSVHVTGHYRLHVGFSDGEEGDVDVSDLKDAGGVFDPLRDPAFFAQAFVDSGAGTISWPNGADLAPEQLRHAWRHGSRVLVIPSEIHRRDMLDPEYRRAYYLSLPRHLWELHVTIPLRIWWSRRRHACTCAFGHPDHSRGCKCTTPVSGCPVHRDTDFGRHERDYEPGA